VTDERRGEVDGAVRQRHRRLVGAEVAFAVETVRCGRIRMCMVMRLRLLMVEG
jgi:hypothetical protein